MKQKHSTVSTRRLRKTVARKPQNWLPFGLMGLGVLVLAAVFALSFNQVGAQTVVPPRVGAPLSNFTLTDINGKDVKLSDHSGQVVLVNTWATWCPPCKAEMPDLNAYYQAHKDQGFTVLAINAGDPGDTAAEFARSKNLAFPVLLDPNTQVLESFGIHSFPTSIVVGRDGLVKNIHLGMYSPEALEADITPLLAK